MNPTNANAHKPKRTQNELKKHIHKRTNKEFKVRSIKLENK